MPLIVKPAHKQPRKPKWTRMDVVVSVEALLSMSCNVSFQFWPKCCCNFGPSSHEDENLRSSWWAECHPGLRGGLSPSNSPSLCYSQSQRATDFERSCLERSCHVAVRSKWRVTSCYSLILGRSWMILQTQQGQCGKSLKTSQDKLNRLQAWSGHQKG